MTGLPSLGPSARHLKLEDFALQAFVGLVVHLIGLAVLVACYYNLYVLDDYILALFWAVICSIPVFRIKIRVIHAMLGMLHWWWSFEYLVLSADEAGGLRLRPLGCGPEDEEGEGAEEVREDLELPPEVMSAAELRGRIASGEKLHAVVQCRRPPEKDYVMSISKRGHWLGTFRPYVSIGDLLGRDLPALWRLGALQLAWMLSPLRRFHRGEAGSQPYFSLLVRLCVLHWTTRFLGAAVIVPVLFLAVHLYLLVVLVRLLFTLLAHLAPHVLSALEQGLQRVPRDYVDAGSACLRHGQVAIRWCCWVVRKRSSRVVHSWLATFLENSHFILSILIIFASLLVSCRVLSLLCLSLRHEAFVIWRTLHKLLQPSPVYQVVMAKVTHLMQAAKEGSAAGLWDYGQSVIETTVPEYQEWLQHNVPDFHILKYVLYDIWRVEDSLGEHWLHQNTSLEALASLAGGYTAAQRAVDSFGPSSFATSEYEEAEEEEEEDVCRDAVAVGAACVRAPKATRARPLRQQLQNTTALLRLLARGNISGAAGHLQDAYVEVASASSLLGGVGEDNRTTITMLDGALHGSTFVARLTMHGTIVLMHVLTIASSMLGQAIVFVTALFYLLASRVSCLEVIGEFLMVIDPSKVIFRISELVVRAVLFSALKMSAFHALFTWLLYSWGRIPVVVVPTVLSALVALVPVVSPVWSVSIWAAVYLWVQGEMASAALALVLNLGVWWQVPTVIYAEIPESNPWLTGLSVVLGIGQFGVAGVVLGPMIASVPLICFNLIKLFNEKRFAAPASPPLAASPPRRQTLLTLYQSETFLSQAAEDGTPPRARSTSTRGQRRRPMTRASPRPRPRSLAPSASSAPSGREGGSRCFGCVPEGGEAAPGPRPRARVRRARVAEELAAEEAASDDATEELDEEDELGDSGPPEECVEPRLARPRAALRRGNQDWRHRAQEMKALAKARRGRGGSEGGHGYVGGEVDNDAAVEALALGPDEDSLQMSDLLMQKNHREISARVLSSSPGGALLKTLYSWDPPSPTQASRQSAERDCFPSGRKRLFGSGASVPDLSMPALQPTSHSRHSSIGGGSGPQGPASECAASAGSSSSPCGVAAG